MRFVVALIALVGCSDNDPIVLGEDGPPPVQNHESEAPVTDPDAPEVVTETLPEMDDPAAWVFTQDVIHEIRIELPVASVDALYVEPYEYALGSVSIDETELAQVGVRLRGKIGSFRELSGKPKFKLDFNRFVDGQTLYGLESLTLNNSVVDCSYLKEPLAYWVFEQAGRPAPRISFARVTVNGDDYGLYLILESPDDVFIGRQYDEPDGNLYDGKYAYYGGWSYTLIDFDVTVHDLFQLEEGVDVGHADIHAVTGGINGYRGTPDFYGELGTLVDWDAIHAHIAAEQWVGHVDGYAMNQNNYRVYFDPADAKAEFLTWDLDYSFIWAWQWGMDWYYPRGILMDACWDSPACYEAQRSAVADLLDQLDTAALLQYYDDLHTLTWPDTQADPRRECGEWDVMPAREALVDWIFARGDEVRGHWGL